MSPLALPAQSMDTTATPITLSDAILMGANLSNADCSRAIFRAARMRGAILRDANLSAATLRDAQVERDALIYALLSATVMPDGAASLRPTLTSCTRLPTGSSPNASIRAIVVRKCRSSPG